MPGATIVGSGRFLPGDAVDNEALSRVMETGDEWIRQRTGIVQRHYASDGQGASDLAVVASERAIEAAGIAPDQIDYIVFNTMTPDYILPGSGALLGTKLGISGVPALDLRQQCAAMPFSFQLVDGLLQTGAAQNVLVVGAEAHAGFMPWDDDWDVVEGHSERNVAPEAFARSTQHRGYTILFGDGAGALVMRRSEVAGHGLLGCLVHSDGRSHGALRIEAGGFRRRPRLAPDAFERGDHLPRIAGKELFKAAVTKLPRVARELCAQHDVSLDEIDWFIAHQANDRINAAVREALGIDESRVPSNIANYGNTSGATIPILMDEMLRDGRVQPGQLLCFLALGAGLNWGAALMRL